MVAVLAVGTWAAVLAPVFAMARWRRTHPAAAPPSVPEPSLPTPYESTVYVDTWGAFSDSSEEDPQP
jgi:hypothetical protein